jgi:hypothetical protein
LPALAGAAADRRVSFLTYKIDKSDKPQKREDDLIRNPRSELSPIYAMSSSLTYNRAFRVANFQPQLLLIISAHEQRPFAASLNSVGTWRTPAALPESRFPCTVEVAIHTILYVRQVYPADLFVRRKKYETPVYQSRHPGLNEYIAGAVKAISDELALVSMSAPFASNAVKLGFHLGVC